MATSELAVNTGLIRIGVEVQIGDSLPPRPPSGRYCEAAQPPQQSGLAPALLNPLPPLAMTKVAFGHA